MAVPFICFILFSMCSAILSDNELLFFNLVFASFLKSPLDLTIINFFSNPNEGVSISPN